MDIVVEAREYRSAMDLWMKRFAVERRVDLQLGKPSVAADVALRGWSRDYFEAPANAVMAPEAPAAETLPIAELALGL